MPAKNKTTDKFIKVNKDAISLKLTMPQQKLVRHKYKCEVGKKTYTFQNKKELCKGIGFSRSTTDKILSGEKNMDNVKIYPI
jgi:hypothetical protein